jgi:hypothetical protein
VFLFSGCSAALFWVIEALWKTFAWAYTPRITKIEEAFRTSKFGEIHPFQIQMDCWVAWKAEALVQFLGRLMIWNVLLPHAVIVVACIALWFVWRPQEQKLGNRG